MEITQAKQKKIKRNKDSLKDLWDNITHTNIYLTGVPEREDREGGREYIWRHIAEDFPNLWNEWNMQVQEAQRQPQTGSTQRGPHQNIL